jgi:predicted DNA binding CopG/RHH family protein
MTRKTIALPQAAFLRVKIEAAKRGIPASRLWGEIVDAYFKARAE